MNIEKQREYYRIKYPVDYRPSFMMDVDNYEIMDVSEYGMKIKVDQDSMFLLNEQFIASAVFPDGRVFELSGQIVRLEQGYVGLELSTPLSFDLIRSEALYIINNYQN